MHRGNSNKILLPSNYEIAIPKGWCCVFRGDVHHCGAAYRRQNDRLHFYMRPPVSYIGKRKRNVGQNLYNVSSMRKSHTIQHENGVFGVAIKGQRIYYLIKKCSIGVKLFWVSQRFVVQHAKNAIRELCLLVHEKRLKLDDEYVAPTPNICIKELRKHLDILKEEYTRSLKT